MPTPSEAEIRTQIGAAINVAHEIFKFGSVNGDNLVGHLDVLFQALETDYAGEVGAAAQAVRSAIASGASVGAVRRMVDPLLRSYARVLDIPETDPAAIMDRIYQHFVDNTYTVTSRVFTFGSVSAGGANVGTGTILRNTKDRNNFDLEAVAPDAWKAKCIADEHSNNARKHEELFEIRGGDASFDGLEQLGSGVIARVNALSGRDSQQLLNNPSFDRYSGTAAVPTEVTGWTVTTSIGNFAIDQANYYRGFDGDGGTPGALKISANDTMTQALSVRRAQFDPTRPYVCQIAYNRQVGTGDGTLTLTLGAKSVAVVLAAQTGWNILKIALDDDCWHQEFNETSMDFKVALSSRTTGYVLVDDIILAPMSNVGGTFLAVVGGATPFLRDDTFTWTDTATDSILQRWFSRLYGRYLPHTAGAPTWAEP
jgi:hypothetical protein